MSRGICHEVGKTPFVQLGEYYFISFDSWNILDYQLILGLWQNIFQNQYFYFLFTNDTIEYFMLSLFKFMEG